MIYLPVWMAAIIPACRIDDLLFFRGEAMKFCSTEPLTMHHKSHFFYTLGKA